jgi:hypothetical protein
MGAWLAPHLLHLDDRNLAEHCLQCVERAHLQIDECDIAPHDQLLFCNALRLGGHMHAPKACAKPCCAPGATNFRLPLHLQVAARMRCGAKIFPRPSAALLRAPSMSPAQERMSSLPKESWTKRPDPRAPFQSLVLTASIPARDTILDREFRVDPAKSQDRARTRCVNDQVAIQFQRCAWESSAARYRRRHRALLPDVRIVVM